MTLIVTALADDAVVQVSDRQLTRRDNPLPEPENKAICVSCADANIAVAYTGSARIAGQPTAEWLTDRLSIMSAGTLTFPQIAAKLREDATTAFRGGRRDLTVVLAGFGPPGPFAATISNVEDGRTSFSAPVKEFVCGFFLRNDRPMQKLDLVFHGMENAIADTIGPLLTKVRTHFLKRSPEERADILVDLVRRAADHPKFGKYIGKECMSVVVKPSEDFAARYHPLGKDPVRYAPNLVGQNMVFKQVSYSVPPGWSVKLGS